jgi:hypothetical protein
MSDTFGHYLLNQVVPAEYRPEGVYTKKKLFTHMARLAKDDPKTYTKTITDIKRLGDQFATLRGISVGLDDIAPIYKARNAIVKPALKEIQKTTDIVARRKIISDTQDKLIEYTKSHPGTMGDMARSGARGNMNQLMKAVGSPVAASDEKDEIQPWLITHSYSEGLKPAEWWAANREARMNAVKSSTEITEPGDLSKILINNASHQVITISDCGTHNGLNFAIDDVALLDRYTAKENTLITPRVISELKKKHTTHVIARSPMTCEANEGVCQHCIGLNSTGKLNKIGDNVGIRASQALGEPLTQMALNAKHGVRIAGQNVELSGLEGFRSILESPESFKSKAALAPEAGTISTVTVAPQGGHYISLGKNKIHVPHGLAVKVTPGDKVQPGDVLSEGVPRPDEVVKYKGLGAGRAYLVNKLQGIYADAGINADPRHFEVIAKSTLNHLRIDEIDDADSANHGLVRGDVIDYNRFRNVISDNVIKTPLHQAEGKHLGEGVLYHLAGTRITPEMIQDFQDAKIPHVKTTMRAPVISPIMAPATRNPLLNPDWLVRLGHRYLKQSLLEGAQKAETSNLHGTHPLPGLIFGTEFGEGDQGRY